MTISYNTGAASSAAGAVTQSTGLQVTLPPGIVVDDWMFIMVGFFTWISGASITDITCTAASGHTWTKQGAVEVSNSQTSGLFTHSVIYKRKATSGDASDVLTFKMVGTPASPDQEWWSCAMGSYSGVLGGVDTLTVNNPVTGSADPILCPDITTGKDNCWVVELGFIAVTGSGDIASGNNCTLRQHASDAGITAALADTNASVGASGTTVSGKGFVTNAGSADWFVTRSLSLDPNPTAIIGTGTISMHKMGLSATGHAPVVGTGTIRMHKMGISARGTIPGAAHMQMHKMGISATGHAPLFASGTIRMHKMGISGSGSAGMSVVFNHTDGNGVDYYDVTSIYNGPSPTVLRVLDPVSPAAGYSHQFLYTLAVEAYPGTTFGDGLDHVQSLGGHDSYNITVVEASFPIDPWFADSSDDPNRRYETFMVRLVEWVKAHLATTGLEEHVLIGFSKSGIGGMGVIMNNPTVFDKCIAWDWPADMDNISRFGSDAAANYGSDEANFDARYNMSATNLDRWKVPFQSKNRLYITGGNLYTGEVDNFAVRLTAKSMLYTNPANVTRSHDWTSGWVAPALASVFTPSTTGTGTIRMKKMGLSGTATAPLEGTGTIRMHKMGLSGAGQVKLRGTGTIHMHKMRIHTPNFASNQASSMFVFTDV
jgi:hypothetical protein